MNKRILIGLGILVLVILAAGGGFTYGTSVGEARANQARQQLFRERFRGQSGQFPGPFQTPQPGQESGERLRGSILGTIEAVEDDVLVISTQEGTLRVRTTDTTLIEKYQPVGVEELETGERVVISGSRNDDGSVTARSIRTLRQSQLPQPGMP